MVQKLLSNTGSIARISPDGSRIVYRDSLGIQIVSTSGGRAITVLPAANLGRSWSPDGKWIWYSAEQGLRKIPSEGGEPVEVPAPAGILEDCSPDGNWLMVEGFARPAPIWHRWFGIGTRRRTLSQLTEASETRAETRDRTHLPVNSMASARRFLGCVVTFD
jgi:hypothetical protein